MSFGSYDNNIYSIDSSGNLHWSYPTGDYVESSPALGSANIGYVGSHDGRLYGLTGAGRLSWSYTTGGVLYSSPAIGSDGGVYLPGRDNALYAFNPHGALQWSFIAAGKMESSPALGSDGSIYVGDGGYLYALSSSGTLIWSFLIGNSMSSSPSISSDGRLYVGNNDNCMYCFGEFIPTPTPTATPTPNYINLTASPTVVPPGTFATLSYACDFSYTGKIKEPTFSNAAFPPVHTTGSIGVRAPKGASFAGNYVFATAFIYKWDGFVRTDLPVENSNLFTIQ
ncbi:MAG: PQQ-binding-like beta-propeller repeat protein [Candidatus Aureabacteria bacterium]|nr:PQQ-binding-like beta-propeller repeat protein [Candidatus Auribacterota bacterium]